MNTSKGFLLLLVALLLILSAMLVRPFLQYVLMALLLGYILHPLQIRLEPRVGASVLATVLMIGATIAVVLPFVIMIVLIASDAMQLVQGIGQDDLAVSQLESTIAQRTGMDMNIAETARASVERVANAMLGSTPDLFGAMYVFGFMGLFVGPIIVGALKVVLELFGEHYHDLEPTAT